MAHLSNVSPFIGSHFVFHFQSTSRPNPSSPLFSSVTYLPGMTCRLTVIRRFALAGVNGTLQVSKQMWQRIHA